ncbi:MAG: DGQHR domain-containing protein [Methanolinea sp.]|jgi:DGQHR domain-containing protein|nr:DGQHR domain-containing protein [Methanolinea sp.]
MICSSCGLKIEDVAHGPYNKNQYVCDKCWNNPALFFPDRLNKTLNLFSEQEHFDFNTNLIFIEILDMFRKYSNNPAESLPIEWRKLLKNQIKIPVIRIKQKDITLYTGKIKAFELLLLGSIDKWDDEYLEGFQRERLKEKTLEIKKFLDNCPIAIIPSIFANFREGSFNVIDGDYGKLVLPIKPGIIRILDGQQRTGGFEEIFSDLRKIHTQYFLPDKYEIIKDYQNKLSFEIPIVFIDSTEIIKKIHSKYNGTIKLTIEDLEGTFFFIINKTQKPVNPSLTDELAYKTVKTGISGIPIIEKEKWRTEIVPIINELNVQNSPLKGLFNLGGIYNKKRPIQLYSFVSSLKPLFSNVDFKIRSKEYKKEYLIKYWEVIKEMFPDCFDINRQKEFLLLRVVSIYALHSLANDIYTWSLIHKLEPNDISSIKKFIEPLKEFSWDKQNSPLSLLGGGKGVRKAHEILLKFLSDKGIEDATLSLKNLN